MNKVIWNGVSFRLCVFCVACAQVSIIHQPIRPDDIQLHPNPLVEAKSVIKGILGGSKVAAKIRLVSFGVRNEETVIYGWKV